MFQLTDYTSINFSLKYSFTKMHFDLAVLNTCTHKFACNKHLSLPMPASGQPGHNSVKWLECTCTSVRLHWAFVYRFCFEIN